MSGWWLEMLEAEHHLRARAEAFGNDPDAAVKRAIASARATGVTFQTAADHEISLMYREWNRDHS